MVKGAPAPPPEEPIPLTVEFTIKDDVFEEVHIKRDQEVLLNLGFNYGGSFFELPEEKFIEMLIPGLRQQLRKIYKQVVVDG